MQSPINCESPQTLVQDQPLVSSASEPLQEIDIVNKMQMPQIPSSFVQPDIKLSKSQSEPQQDDSTKNASSPGGGTEASTISLVSPFTGESPYSGSEQENFRLNQNVIDSKENSGAHQSDVKILNQSEFVAQQHAAKVSNLEEQLYQYLFKNLSQLEMTNINKFILVPIGLPGMGKTTLSRFLNASSQNQQAFSQRINQNLQDQSLMLKKAKSAIDKTQKLIEEHEIQTKQIKIKFEKISYDRMFTQYMKEYTEKHPEVETHAAFDIIRGQADKAYLEAVKSYCQGQDYDDQNQYENFGVLKQTQNKQIIYLDRNNTPDIWKDIQATIMSTQGGKARDCKTVLIVPEQHNDFDGKLYNQLNSICPHMMYECIKRIFSRKSHDCLSSENKPKVVEVILKFAKLYDGIDFNCDDTLRQHFDDFVRLDFLQFNQRVDIEKQTVDVIAECYNQTPPNFVPPSDEVINLCIEAVEKQILIDQAYEQEKSISKGILDSSEYADGPTEVLKEITLQPPVLGEKSMSFTPLTQTLEI